jgi:hypothetical protein
VFEAIHQLMDEDEDDGADADREPLGYATEGKRRKRV